MSNIETALLSRLTAASPGAALSAALIKYENLNPAGAIFVPPSAGLWYRAWFLDGEPVAAAVGDLAPNRHVGIFQIDVLYGPAGKGTKAVDDETERLRVCFARGTGLIYSGQIVEITKAWVVRPSQDEPAYFKQILKTAWMADVPN